MLRILLVEDEAHIRDAVKLNLELEGYEVVSTGNGRKALELFDGQHFDLLLLDVMLPEVDGFDITEKVRLTNTEVPILLLTAKDMSQDRVTGLKKGADDYLTKPFNLEELLLRVSKLLKRSQRQKGDPLSLFEFGGNKINFETFEAITFRGEAITLTKKETMLLKLLAERKEEVVVATKSCKPFGVTMFFRAHVRLTTSFCRSENTSRKTPKRHAFSIQSGGWDTSLPCDPGI